jgi:hypothetical protein
MRWIQSIRASSATELAASSPWRLRSNATLMASNAMLSDWGDSWSRLLIFIKARGVADCLSCFGKMVGLDMPRSRTSYGARQDENGEHDGTALCRANHCQVDELLRPKLDARPRQFMCERRLPRLCGRDHGRRRDIFPSHDRTRRHYQPASQPRGIRFDSGFAPSPRLLTPTDRSLSGTARFVGLRARFSASPFNTGSK